MLEKFFKDVQSNNNNVAATYDALSDESRTKLLKELKNLDQYKSLIETEDLFLVDLEPLFYLVEQEVETLGELFSGNLPIEGQKVTIRFRDINGEFHDYPVSRIGGKLYFTEKSGYQREITKVVEESNVYQYVLSGKEVLIKQLSESYQEFLEKNTPIDTLIQQRNIDVLLKRWNELKPQDFNIDLLFLTYSYQEDSVHKYGTILHKAIQKLSLLQLQVLFNKLSIYPQFREFVSLTDEQGRTIFDLAQSLSDRTIKAYIISIDPNYVQAVQPAGNINTHTTSVNKSSARSILKLYNRFVGNHDLDGAASEAEIAQGSIDRQKLTPRFATLISHKLIELQSVIEEKIAYDDARLFAYIKQTLPVGDQQTNLNDPGIQELIKGTRFQLRTASRLMASIIKDDNFCGISGYQYYFAASKVSVIGVTYREILAINYAALSDVVKHRDFVMMSSEAQSAHRRSVFLNFIQHLYETRRGYNLFYNQDNIAECRYSSTPDQAICDGGTINELASSLNTIHQEVTIVSVDRQILLDEFKREITKSILQAQGNITLEQLLAWQKTGAMPDLLKAIEKSKEEQYLANIPDASKEFFTPEQLSELFNQAISTLKLPKEFRKKLANINIRELSKDEIIDLLKKNLLPLFISTENGYIHRADYLRQTNPELFNSLIAEGHGLLLINHQEIEVALSKDDNEVSKTIFNSFDFKHLSIETLSEIYKHSKIKEFLHKDQELIFKACKEKKYKIVRLLIALGIDINARDKYSNNMLMLAASFNDLVMLRSLLDKGAELNAKNDIGATPLTIAAQHGHLAVVKELLNRGDDIEVKDSMDRTPLMFAARNGHLKVVEELLDRGANTEAKFKQNDSIPIMFAAQHGYLAVVEELLNRRRDHINAQNKEGMTPLIWAATNGHFLVVKELLARGANRESKDNKGYDSLMLAVKRDKSEVVKLLQDDLNKTDSDGYTVLMRAVLINDQELVDKLLKYKVNTEITNRNGNTALSLAVKQENLAIVEHLIQAGAKVKVKVDNKAYGNLLEYAIKENKLAAAAKLIDLKGGKDVKLNSSRTGKTLLMWAAEKNSLDALKLLIAKKANVEAVDKNNVTALMHAAAAGNIEAMRILSDEGKASINACDSSGNSILLYAKNPETIEYLLSKDRGLLNKKNHQGQTALMCAKKPEIVNKLKELGENLEEKDNNGKTALMLALDKSVEMVRFLIQIGADLDAKDKDGKTALDLSREKECKGAIELLSRAAKRKIVEVAAAPAAEVPQKEEDHDGRAGKRPHIDVQAAAAPASDKLDQQELGKHSRDKKEEEILPSVQAAKRPHVDISPAAASSRSQPVQANGGALWQEKFKLTKRESGATSQRDQDRRKWIEKASEDAVVLGRKK